MKNRFFDASCDSASEKLAAIRLARSNNIGPVTFLKLIKKYGSPSESLKAAELILDKKGEKIFSKAEAEKEIEQTEKFGAEIITIFDECYPALLAEIYDPPVVMTVKGNKTKLKELNRTVGMVGARFASANAISLSYKFAKELAEQNACVISGLAKGIDTGAHKGALAAKNNEMTTIAVTAGGIDNIYPPENEKLYEEIAERGVIITENSFGRSPKAENFPRRNRIISGLSEAVLVVEAALKSGSLITARFALEHGRELCCIPGFPLDPRSEGTNMLIKKGANLITSSKDILDVISNFDFETPKIERTIFSEDEIFDVEQNEEMKKEIIDSELLNIISETPVPVDDLINIYKFSPAELNSKLLEYEILGQITRYPGNKIAKVS